MKTLLQKVQILKSEPNLSKNSRFRFIEFFFFDYNPYKQKSNESKSWIFESWILFVSINKLTEESETTKTSVEVTKVDQQKQFYWMRITRT